MYAITPRTIRNGILVGLCFLAQDTFLADWIRGLVQGPFDIRPSFVCSAVLFMAALLGWLRSLRLRKGAGVGQVKSTPVTWLEPTYPLTRANAPRERAVLMRSSGCGASPRPEAFRAAGYGNRRP